MVDSESDNIQVTFTKKHVLLIKKHVTLDKLIVCFLLSLIWGIFTIPWFLFYSDSQSNEETNKTNISYLERSNNVTDGKCNHSDFYFEEKKGYCVPNCHTWRSYSPPISTIVDSVGIACLCIGILANILIVILSCLNRKTVLKFPSVFVTYMSVTGSVYYASVLISYFDRYKLFCVLMDLEESAFTTTPYCIIQGAIVDYVFTQLIIWWLSHIASIFFMIVYPLRAKSFMKSRKMNYVHGTIVLVGLIVPIFSPLVTITSSIDPEDPERFAYRVLVYPPRLCSAVKREITFYTHTIPLNFMISIGITLMVLIFWQLHKQKHAENKFQVTTTEKKLFVTFCYYILLQVGSSTSSVITTNRHIQFLNKLHSYFVCARYSADCEQPEFISPVIIIAYWLLITMLPLFQLAYVINCEKMKSYFKEKGDYIQSHITNRVSVM